MLAKILVSAPLKNQNGAKKLTKVCESLGMFRLILISFIFPQEIKLNVACNMIAIEPNNRMPLANCRKWAIKGHQSIAASLRFGRKRKH